MSSTNLKNLILSLLLIKVSNSSKYISAKTLDVGVMMV